MATRRTQRRARPAAKPADSPLRQEWRAAERRVQTTRDWFLALARRIGVVGFGDLMNAAWAQYSRRNEVWPDRPADTPPEANGKSDAPPEREDHGELIDLLKHTYAAIVELAEAHGVPLDPSLVARTTGGGRIESERRFGSSGD